MGQLLLYIAMTAVGQSFIQGRHSVSIRLILVPNFFLNDFPSSSVTFNANFTAQEPLLEDFPSSSVIFNANFSTSKETPLEMAHQFTWFWTVLFSEGCDVGLILA